MTEAPKDNLKPVEGKPGMFVYSGPRYTPETLRALAADVLRGWQRRRIVAGNEMRAYAAAWQEQLEAVKAREEAASDFANICYSHLDEACLNSPGVVNARNRWLAA